MNNELTSTKDSYSSLSVALHWLMLVLIVTTYALMDFKGIYPRGSYGREVMAAWHYTIGLSIFFLVLVRIWARVTNITPVINPPLPRLQIYLSLFVRFALYALMISLPVLGWLAISAKGTVIGFYGIELPTLVNKDKELFTLFKRIHESLAMIGYFLIGLHAAAALFHHYFKRDNTLTLMVPWLRRRTGQ
jgi:cytochrome b561